MRLLVSDVAVDLPHVRELADSIKAEGPIQPVLVREETLELIDGFHRVAAMGELGFSEVEAILMPCTDETFWDWRITSASLHKAVTFARVVDWIDEIFKLSPISQRYNRQYKNAFSLFDVASRNAAPEEVKTWATTKAQQWGLSVGTIRNWLYTAQSLAPDLLTEAKSPASTVEAGDVTFSHYYRVAETLPGQPELQRQVVQKAKDEGLTGEQTREVARAVRQAADEREVRTILSEPASRTADELARTAKVESLLSRPSVEEPARAERRQYENVGRALEILLDIQQMLYTLKQFRTEQTFSSLTPAAKQELARSADELMGELQQFLDSLQLYRLYFGPGPQDFERKTLLGQQIQMARLILLQAPSPVFLRSYHRRWYSVETTDMAGARGFIQERAQRLIRAATRLGVYSGIGETTYALPASDPLLVAIAGTRPAIAQLDAAANP